MTCEPKVASAPLPVQHVFVSLPQKKQRAPQLNYSGTTAYFQVRYLLKSTRHDLLARYFPSAPPEGNVNSGSGSVSGGGGGGMRLRRFTRQFSETFMTQVGGGGGSGRASVTSL